MVKVLKITMEMSLTVVQVAPNDLPAGPISSEDMADIEAEAHKAGTGDPLKTLNSARVVSAEIVEV